MKKNILCCSLQIIVLGLMAQTAIMGKVMDEETGEELSNTVIVFSKNGVFSTQVKTDFYGNYFTSIDPGEYDMIFRSLGLSDKLITDVLIKKGHVTKLDEYLTSAHFCGHIIQNYKIPLIENDLTTSDEIIHAHQIKKQAAKNIGSLILNTPGVSFSNF